MTLFIQLTPPKGRRGMQHVSKWTFEEHHCPFLTSLPVHPCLYHSCTRTELSAIHSFFNKPHSLLPQGICMPFTSVEKLFPILLPFPLPQPFYLVGFHFLAIPAKHHLLRELFLKLFPSHKYHYRNVLWKIYYTLQIYVPHCEYLTKSFLSH